jgi:hypothetical protein
MKGLRPAHPSSVGNLSGGLGGQMGAFRSKDGVSFSEGGLDGTRGRRHARDR